MISVSSILLGDACQLPGFHHCCWMQETQNLQQDITEIVVGENRQD